MEGHITLIESQLPMYVVGSAPPGASSVLYIPRTPGRYGEKSRMVKDIGKAKVFTSLGRANQGARKFADRNGVSFDTMCACPVRVSASVSHVLRLSDIKRP